MFITFEGADGAGKSLQAKLFADFLVKEGRNVMLTSEPGGTKIGTECRKLLLSEQIDANSEVMLYVLARYNHFVYKIKPALAQGICVVCDRFVDSTIAYQGYASGVDIDFIYDFHNSVLGEDFYPDLTFFLDLEPEIALARAYKTKYEDKGLQFQKDVVRGFRRIAKQDRGKRITTVYAEGLINNVHENIKALFSSLNLSDQIAVTKC